jgi:CobQ-like glutamine amidotransferase family enzyme
LIQLATAAADQFLKGEYKMSGEKIQFLGILHFVVYTSSTLTDASH